jgi:hypothetical protein
MRCVMVGERESTAGDPPPFIPLLYLLCHSPSVRAEHFSTRCVVVAERCSPWMGLGLGVHGAVLYVEGSRPWCTRGGALRGRS